MGRPEKALEEADRIRAITTGSRAPLGAATSGDPAEALRAYYRWSSRPENVVAAEGSQTLFVRARALAAASDIEGSLDLLDAAVSAKDPRLLELRVDPRFDVLRSHPRFEAVLAALSGGSTTIPLRGRRPSP